MVRMILAAAAITAATPAMAQQSCGYHPYYGFVCVPQPDHGYQQRQQYRSPLAQDRQVFIGPTDDCEGGSCVIFPQGY